MIYITFYCMGAQKDEPHEQCVGRHVIFGLI